MEPSEVAKFQVTYEFSRVDAKYVIDGGRLERVMEAHCNFPDGERKIIPVTLRIQGHKVSIEFRVLSHKYAGADAYLENSRTRNVLRMFGPKYKFSDGKRALIFDLEKKFFVQPQPLDLCLLEHGFRFNITVTIEIPAPAFIVEKALVQDLLENESSRDFKLVSEKDGTEISCHRLILTVSSEFFKTLITNSLDSGKKPRDETRLPFSGKTLRYATQFMYERKVKFEEEENLMEVLDAGTMMLLPGLVRQCEEILVKNLNENNNWDMLLLASKFDMVTLRTHAFAIGETDPEFPEKVEGTNDFNLAMKYARFCRRRFNQKAKEVNDI